MTTPNLLTISNISPHTASINATTATSNVIVNGPNTNVSTKINTILLTNGIASTAQANISLNRSGTTYNIGANISVPGYSTMVLLAKDTILYLEENDSLQANASVNSAITVTASFEQMS